ncbi:hypothetical protein Pmani_000069 [Petrolisthes manimaculis]|uniref:Mutator-like transposase domain-containing protein n=1 Tax=Petrolisthes manimaculis TaxID=1843537 RepID=A0AAE1QNL9_9EUCA|nr:hypothetical protein Pmani_000069 [Petrolisthes manimaculis]
MRPFAKKYNYYKSRVVDAAREKVKDVMNSAITAIKQLHSAKNGVYDIKVIYDGSWQKRGHTSNLAVGEVIEAETGLVIDYETVSKYCEKCTKKENAMKRKEISKDDFEVWLVGHKEECKKNYEGSSGGMEAAAAVKLFGRSLDNNLRY